MIFDNDIEEFIQKWGGKINEMMIDYLNIKDHYPTIKEFHTPFGSIIFNLK